MQAAQVTHVSVGDCRGCGVYTCIDRGDRLADGVDDVVGDAGGDECGIDHGNASGTLDLNFLNPCFEKCAQHIQLLTVTYVRRVQPMRSSHTCSSFWFLNSNL